MNDRDCAMGHFGVASCFLPRCKASDWMHRSGCGVVVGEDDDEAAGKEGRYAASAFCLFLLFVRTAYLFYLSVDDAFRVVCVRGGSL